MKKYLIVMADGRSGRGTRGLNLYWFLKTFHGGAVQVVSTADLRKGATYACDFAFVGLPTELRKEDLARVSYRRLAVFDYEDTVNILLDESSQFLSGLTDRYLKVWNEPGWPAPWKFGVLPIRRQARLPLYLRWLAFWRALGTRDPERDYDVTFLGAPTGQEARSQRVRWMQEIRDTESEFTFWGGLVASPSDRERLTAAGIDVPPLLYEGGRIPYGEFFELMRRSRIVLTPKGNAPWSYRHYEAIYAGAIPVSCDLTNVTTLIPLPLNGMVHVADDAPVVPKIEEALALIQRKPLVLDSNREFLEQFLTYGDYSRKKPELLHRFESSLGR
jgi:hypothetical protein